MPFDTFFAFIKHFHYRSHHCRCWHFVFDIFRSNFAVLTNFSSLQYFVNVHKHRNTTLLQTRISLSIYTHTKYTYWFWYSWTFCRIDFLIRKTLLSFLRFLNSPTLSLSPSVCSAEHYYVRRIVNR